MNEIDKGLLKVIFEKYTSWFCNEEFCAAKVQ
jgi:hypothetical protein